MLRAPLVALLATGACVAAVRPKFPDDVAAGVARDAMRRLETDTFVIYYPAKRRDEVMRFAARAEGCGQAERAQTRLRNTFSAAKPILVMPDVPFNNAFVVPPALGDEDYAVIPTFDTFDFATEFGIPPDPAYIGCHELTHYAHEMQIAGLWYAIDYVLGNILSPQDGLDSWFWEGLAVHYETALQPGAGRDRWPIFTGEFAAAYAGGRLGGGALSELDREPPPGGNYLVGSMFVDFLARRYGDEALWRVIEAQAQSWTIIIGVSGRFKEVYGKSLSDLIDEFAAETARRFPVRPTPATQRRVRVAGDEARYARGPDGTEAVLASDVGAPAHLDVFGPDGARRAHVALVGVVPPRTLVLGDPALASGLSIARNGDVYLTAIDLGATYQVTRLLRLRAGATSFDEVATDLGPGLCVSPDGSTYFFAQVDGDRWSLAAYDLARGATRVVTAMPAGEYVLTAQPSPDGQRLIASVWAGRFVLRVIDLGTGTVIGELRGDGDTPVYDGAFADDGHVVYLGEIDGRFQAIVRAIDHGRFGPPATATDAPYAVLNARAAGGTIRFLNREGWEWTIDEVAVPGSPADATDTVAPTVADVIGPRTIAPHVVSDEPYHAYDHLFVPSLHTVAFYSPSSAASLIGASLGGSDRLGFNRWAIAGYLDPQTDEPAGQVAYLNANLAPWLFQASATWTRWTEDAMDDVGDKIRLHREERDAQASFGRTWRGSWFAAVRAISTEIHDHAPCCVPIDLRLAGPGLSLAYAGFEATPYAGARRGVALSTDATWYPARLAQPGTTITDLRGELDVALPALGNATIHASGVGRDLVSSTGGLLQLGGFAALTPLAQGSTDKTLPEFTGPDLPPLVSFGELLRGYEDYPITTDRAATAELRLRVPLIIDHGWASTLYFLPATFVRQIDLEIFAAGAVDETGGVRRDHAAAGAAITLRIALFRVPLAITYQGARRVRDDDAWTQLVEIGPDQ